MFNKKKRIKKLEIDLEDMSVRCSDLIKKETKIEQSNISKLPVAPSLHKCYYCDTTGYKMKEFKTENYGNNNKEWDKISICGTCLNK